MLTLANFVRVTLYADITDAATEIRFDPAIAPFNAPPDPSGRTAYAVLIDNLSAPSKFEIISYTKVEFSRLRGVTRGVDGTTARAWAEGAYITQDIPATLVDPLGANGVDGQILKSTNTGLEFGSVDWSEVAGKPVSVSDQALKERGDPVAPFPGTARIFFRSSDGNLVAKFSNGSTSIIS